ncbi:biosynthetic-type acetolactate synthase large subunit [Oribacterium sp. NK2B42]|uniref:biosynthetic-type acetolactate synthase large subunit n=1 Tax=Oribacterium sp. NK2B42 TaxID=689781 RepID=UPI0003FFD62C|nr:biosynthetic-type acetolactate synthase large subunit [Oribacterium sp. NK2B42]
MRLKGAQILIEELVKQGVDTVFGYPGGAVLDIYDELYKNSDRINHIISAHEQGACHAADGYARASGKTGVVIATSGPGATNLVTGIANANLDSVPLVAITGNVSINALGRDSFQEVDIVGITQPVVKHNFMVRSVQELEQTIKEAFLIANSGRKGPVLIDIPKNVQTDMCEYGIAVVPRMPDKPKVPYVKEAALEAIKNCKRPFIYCGGGVLASGAEKEVLELSHRLDAPIGLSMMGRTAIPDSYDYNLGMCGMHGQYAATKAQAECDLMLAIGVRFSDRATGDISEYTRKCTVIHIDIDKAEFGKNVSPDVCLQGEIKGILQDLLKDIQGVRHKEWREEVEEFKKTRIPDRPGEFCPKNIIETVRKHVQDDTVVATDVGQHQMWTVQFYDFEQPRTLLTSGGLGTMGYGLGAAIGGCIGSGRKRTVLFTSEGSFGMNLNELCTVVSQELPITVVILDNNVLGMVRQWQGIFYEGRYSQTTLARKTNFAALADAFGSKGYSVSTLEELEKVLEETDKEPAGSFVIDCHISEDEKVLPMIPPGKSIKSIILKD